MTVHKLHFQEEIQINPSRKRSRKSSGDGWVMSFADVVTVLLCFFIIFYMLEKQLDKSVGFGPNIGTVQAYKAKMEAPEVLSLIETMKLLPEVSVINKEQFLEVHFPPEMFFASGETKLTSEGTAVINKIIEPLKNIKSGYILQIQGYTDNSSVRDLSGRWWKNNMELSIVRSLEVYEHFLKKGVDKRILSVTGFGANKPLSNQNADMQRRISIKFEPVLDVKK
ncbi:MAG: chemotaxis protein MotB [Bacteriovoracaceae bacterium]|jgi:chemotaxis protein MotB